MSFLAYNVNVSIDTHNLEIAALVIVIVEIHRPSSLILDSILSSPLQYEYISDAKVRYAMMLSTTDCQYRDNMQILASTKSSLNIQASIPNISKPSR